MKGVRKEKGEQTEWEDEEREHRKDVRVMKWGWEANKKKAFVIFFSKT